MSRILLIAPLFALLAVAIFFAARAFMLEGPDMPVELYVAMALGIVFSILVGSGLMALVFYSSRHGYDDLNRQEREKDES